MIFEEYFSFEKRASYIPWKMFLQGAIIFKKENNEEQRTVGARRLIDDGE